MSQSFHIAWAPVPKGRPRFASRTLPNGKSFSRAYTPAATRDAEANIRFLILQAKPKLYGEGIPLALDVEFVLARPKSVKRAHPTTKPDLDNFLKLLEDAGNGYIWHDDSQITVVRMSKRYTVSGESAHIEMKVTELAT